MAEQQAVTWHGCDSVTVRGQYDWVIAETVGYTWSEGGSTYTHGADGGYPHDGPHNGTETYETRWSGEYVYDVMLEDGETRETFENPEQERCNREAFEDARDIEPEDAYDCEYSYETWEGRCEAPTPTPTASPTPTPRPPTSTPQGTQS